MEKSDLYFKRNALWIYNTYLTEYLLFSDSYKQFATIGADGISTEYLKCLEYMVSNMAQHQVYPLVIMDRLKDFVQLLLKNSKNEEDKQHLFSIKTILENTIWEDSFEVYKDEYLKRYATIQNSCDFNGLPVSQLQEDIQRDFLDFHYFLYGDESEEVPSDFLSFLNRLLVDEPDFFADKIAKKRVISILKNSCLEGKEHYIHLISNQSHFSLLRGSFDFTQVESMYFDVLIDEIAFSRNIQKYLSNIPTHLVYMEPFIKELSLHVRAVTSSKKMWDREKKNLLTLFDFMKDHMNEIKLFNKQEVSSKIEDLASKVRSCFAYSADEFSVRVARAQMPYSRLSVMQYLLGKIDIDTLVNLNIQKYMDRYIDWFDDQIFMYDASKMKLVKLTSGLLNTFDYDNVVMRPIVDNLLNTIDNKENMEKMCNSYLKSFVKENRDQLLEADIQHVIQVVLQDIMFSIDRFYRQWPGIFFDETISGQAQKFVNQIYSVAEKKQKKQAKQLLKQIKRVYQN